MQVLEFHVLAWVTEISPQRIPGIGHESRIMWMQSVLHSLVVFCHDPRVPTDPEFRVKLNSLPFTFSVIESL